MFLQNADRPFLRFSISFVAVTSYKDTKSWQNVWSGVVMARAHLYVDAMGDGLIFVIAVHLFTEKSFVSIANSGNLRHTNHIL